jgi:hypothetical protein
MRNTRWISLLGGKARRVTLAGALCFCGWGCHHHHYYYSGTPVSAVAPGCPPGTTVLPSNVSAAGPVCDVTDGPVITSNSGRSTTISDGRRSRVVVSEPSGGKSLFGWRPTDPEASTASTQVDGALGDSSVRK